MFNNDTIEQLCSARIIMDACSTHEWNVVYAYNFVLRLIRALNDYCSREWTKCNMITFCQLQPSAFYMLPEHPRYFEANGLAVKFAILLPPCCPNLNDIQCIDKVALIEFLNKYRSRLSILAQSKILEIERPVFGIEYLLQRYGFTGGLLFTLFVYIVMRIYLSQENRSRMMEDFWKGRSHKDSRMTELKARQKQGKDIIVNSNGTINTLSPIEKRKWFASVSQNAGKWHTPAEVHFTHDHKHTLPMRHNLAIEHKNKVEMKEFMRKTRTPHRALMLFRPLIKRNPTREEEMTENQAL